MFQLSLEIQLEFYAFHLSQVLVTKSKHINLKDDQTWKFFFCSDFRYESNGIFVLGVGFFFFR